MIASVANANTITPAVRPSTDDTATKQRLEAARQAAQTAQTAAQATAVTAASTEEPAAVVSISRQAADQATAETAPPAPPENSATTSPPKSYKPALAYEAADTDTDGKISAFEQQSYDFRHPAIKAYKELASAAAAADNAAAKPEDKAATGA